MLLEKFILAKHKKTGKDYKIIGFVLDNTNTVDGQTMVLYQSLTTHNQAHFVREIKEFKEKFECQDLTPAINGFINVMDQYFETE